MSLKFAYFKYSRIGYKITGNENSNTIMLIPGFTESLEIFDTIQKQLSEHYKVISIDLLGTFSSTEFFISEKNLTMSLFAEATIAVASAEKVEQFCALGHSMGGYISLEIAYLFPEKLLGLGIIHSTAYADSQERKDFRLKSIEFINNYGSEKFVEQIVSGLYTDPYKKANPDSFLKHLAFSQTIEKDVLISQYKAMMFRRDYSEMLQTFHKPVLFLAGDEDNSVTLKDTLSQCHLPPVSQISILKKTGHMGFVEQPVQSSQILRNYCQLVFSF